MNTFKKALIRLESANAAMYAALSVLPCSAKEAKERFPELRHDTIDRAIADAVDAKSVACDLLGIPMQVEPTHLLRHAARLGFSPVTRS